MNLYNIQWLTFFSLCACLAVIFFAQRSHTARDESSLGLGKGIVALLGQWIGLSAFLASSQASYQYGIIGLLGYSAAGLISYLLLYLLLARERKPRPPHPELLIFLYRLEGILIAVLAGKMILNLIYGWSPILSISVVILFFLVILLFGIGTRFQNSFVIVLLSMAATMLLPTLVYLKVSVPTVYSGVKFLATEMLRLDQPLPWYVSGALLIRFFTQGLLNPGIRTIYRQIKPTRRLLSFILSPLFWFFVPLSIGSLSFVAKAEAVWPNLPDEVSILIVGHFGGELGIVLLGVTLILVLLSTISRYMEGKAEERQPAEQVTRIATIVLAGAIAYLFPALTILDTMLYFTLIWAAVAPVILLARKLQGVSLAAVCIGLLAGMYYTWLYGVTIGVITDFVASLLVMVLITIFTKQEKGGIWLE